METHPEAMFTCHTIHPARVIEDGVTSSGVLFDAVRYSRMKFGSISAARWWGRQLGQHLLREAYPYVVNNRPLEAVVIYKAVPPACYALSRFCLDVINEERVRGGLEPGRIVQIRASSTFPLNYAQSDGPMRRAALAAVSYDTDGHEFSDKSVLVVDDIRVTGTAEQETRRILDAFQPHAVVFAYLACVEERDGYCGIPVEDALNKSFVRDLTCLLQIVRHDEFMLTIRTLQWILSHEVCASRDGFLLAIPDERLYEIYAGAISTGPAFLTNYADGVQDVVRHLSKRGLL